MTKIQEAITYLRKGWCKDVCAKKADNTRTYAEDPEACSWCIVGALLKVGVSGNEVFALAERSRELFGTGLSDFNDVHAKTVDDVIKRLEALDAA
jgi:hypothetical protein